VSEGLARVTIVPNELEAELLCALLRSAGITCGHRITDYGAGAWDGVPTGGPREVVVPESRLGDARAVLAASPPDDIVS
jgi:Putative prokaryotic signal transducing protein